MDGRLLKLLILKKFLILKYQDRNKHILDIIKKIIKKLIRETHYDKNATCRFHLHKYNIIQIHVTQIYICRLHTRIASQQDSNFIIKKKENTFALSYY